MSSSVSLILVIIKQFDKLVSDQEGSAAEEELEDEHVDGECPLVCRTDNLQDEVDDRQIIDFCGAIRKLDDID